MDCELYFSSEGRNHFNEDAMIFYQPRYAPDLYYFLDYYRFYMFYYKKR